MGKITVLDKEITVSVLNEEDYICITDIAKYKDAERTDYIIQNWLRNRNTIEFIGIWGHLNNPNFNPIEFDGFGMLGDRRAVPDYSNDIPTQRNNKDAGNTDTITTKYPGGIIWLQQWT